MTLIRLATVDGDLMIEQWRHVHTMERDEWVDLRLETVGAAGDG
ncbi:hypothetical protein [Streptomyces sp. MUSC 125]|nr:hypothetical protein [Streptomyces sp. MUSC 125]